LGEKMSEKEILDVTTEVAKEIAKDVYEDAGKPIAKPTGELVGLVPRAIKAALSPLEKWILQREYNVEETRKLLEQKLESTPPDQIEAPEPHIAVPAMQYISYCMDNEELREMYANLLASSMKKDTKKNAHPSFVEIIKQLCPDEAKLLRHIYHSRNIPLVYLDFHKDNGRHSVPDIFFSNAPILCGCEEQVLYVKYFDNLERLGLIKCTYQHALANLDAYDPIFSNKHYLFVREQLIKLYHLQSNKISTQKGVAMTTEFGNSFCQICLNA
jgi:hypothetical protein